MKNYAIIGIVALLAACSSEEVSERFPVETTVWTGTRTTIQIERTEYPSGEVRFRCLDSGKPCSPEVAAVHLP
jgi:hypothetical protein